MYIYYSSIISKHNMQTNHENTTQTVVRAKREKKQVPFCTICTEKFNVTTHLPIQCPYCEFEACRTCCKTYLLNQTDPKCMNNDCEHEWTRKFMNSVFTREFITNEYKKHRENVLFDQERALLPATQVLVENEVRKENIVKKNIDLKNQIDILRHEMQNLNNEYWIITRTSNEEQPAERRTFVRACPDENCRGFLTTQWKCGICEKWACPTCHEIKGLVRDDPHTCNPNNVATAELLATDTKCCPNCGIGIFKIDGCFGRNIPIPLYNGGVKMSQEIDVGDILVGPDGLPRSVIQLCSGEDELYEIRQSRIEIIDENNIHVSNTRSTNCYTCKKEDYVNYINCRDDWECKCETLCCCDYNTFCNNPIDILPSSYVVNSKHNLVLYNENNMEIVISVEDYNLCSSELKQTWFGVQCIKPDTIKYNNIHVIPLGKGLYYGWKLEENNKFLLLDNTLVSNCDQMWCTDCHTAFSWRTGRIQTQVHNPHYYEWLRRTNNGVAPRNPGDVPGGCNNRQITHHTFRDFYSEMNSKKLKGYRETSQTKDIMHKLSMYCQSIVHLRFNEIIRYRYNYVENNQQLRIKYMRNMIDEDNFKLLIQQHEKKHQRNLEIRNILQLVHDTCSDIIFRFYDEFNKSSWKDDFSIIHEMDAIISYANECLLDICNIYKCKTIQFNNELRVV